MKSLHIIALTTLALMAVCCGKVTSEDALLQAEKDLSEGNIQMVAKGCKMLTDTTIHDLTSTQMVRVSLLYAKLAEMSEDTDYMASATECFQRAIALDCGVDSLDTYIQNLDVESQGVVRVIREVSGALNSPCEITEDVDGAEMIYVDSLEVQ